MSIFNCYYSSPMYVEVRRPSNPETVVCTMRVSDSGIPYYDDLLNATCLLCDHFDLGLMNKLRQTAYNVYATKAIYEQSILT